MTVLWRFALVHIYLCVGDCCLYYYYSPHENTHKDSELWESLSVCVVSGKWCAEANFDLWSENRIKTRKKNLEKPSVYVRLVKGKKKSFGKVVVFKVKTGFLEVPDCLKVNYRPWWKTAPWWKIKPSIWEEKKELWCLFGLALSNVALKRAIYTKTAQKYCGYCSFSWDFTSRWTSVMIVDTGN